MMKALMFDRLGPPIDVVSLRDKPEPVAGPGEALVKVLLSPVIPGDSLFTRGLYPPPMKPRFPGETAGNYGVGVVEATGRLVTAKSRGFWAEKTVVPRAWLVPLPETFRHDLGAEFLNLVTAWDMLEKSRVKRGQWLAVTGGNSTVSAILTQFAAALGVRVLSIVRKKRADPDLTALGAEVVLARDEPADLREAVLDITGGLDGLIDCVGGPDFAALARSLKLGSPAVIYGGFDPEPFSLHNLDILLNLLEIHIYVYRYFFTPPPAEEEGRVRQILALSAELDLMIPTAGRHALEAWKEALAGEGPGRRYFAPNG
jgi:NADPH:quinone reductase-like Zn-dependent oxidoreductase